MSGYSAYVLRMCAVHTYSTDYLGANARAFVQDGQCALFSPHIPLVVVASMHAHPSRMETSE
jgi:hypothetical protein